MHTPACSATGATGRRRRAPGQIQQLLVPLLMLLIAICRIFVQVPWSKLGTEPVVAEFDRLYIVASPREDDSSKGSCPQNVDDAIAAAHAAEQAAKRQRIDTAEDTWLKVRGLGTAKAVRPGAPCVLQITSRPAAVAPSGSCHLSA